MRIKLLGVYKNLENDKLCAEIHLTDNNHPFRSDGEIIVLEIGEALQTPLWKFSQIDFESYGHQSVDSQHSTN